MEKAKPFSISKREVWEAYNGSWSDGRCGSTSVCGGTNAERHTGCGVLRVVSRTCSRTGVSGRRRLDTKRLSGNKAFITEDFRSYT